MKVRIMFKIALSLLCAGFFYFIWLYVSLLLIGKDGNILKTILWVLAPVVMALGFAIGILVFERKTRGIKIIFLRIYIWPLVGCAIGAGIVYWFGPMLIVFGMFAVGMASVIIREILWII